MEFSTKFLVLKSRDQGGAASNDLNIQGKVVGITNFSQWSKFGRDLIEKEKLVWHLEGFVSLTVLYRTYQNVRLSKDVTVPGRIFREIS